MNPFFTKQTNEDQDPIILPQDDNQQGDMLDPATMQPTKEPQPAPLPEQEITEPGHMAGAKKAMDPRTHVVAQGAVDSFEDTVNEGDRENDIYDFVDYLKCDYRADTPAGLYDEFENEAVRIWKKKHKQASNPLLRRVGGRQAIRDGVAKLRAMGIKTTADLDKWIKEHPKTETKGPYAGSRSLMSRYDALKELAGEDAATWILHDMATDAAAKELPKRGAVSPDNYEGDTIEEQVAHLMEQRSFSEDGKGDDWAIYSRNTEYPGDGTWIKVFFKGGKVTKADMFDREPENVLETRLGFDGVHSFTQAYGD